MSCKECDIKTDNIDGYPFRWGASTIVICGCQQHVKEVMNVLRDYQHQKAIRDYQHQKAIYTVPKLDKE